MLDKLINVSKEYQVGDQKIVPYNPLILNSVKGN